MVEYVEQSLRECRIMKDTVDESHCTEWLATLLGVTVFSCEEVENLSNMRLIEAQYQRNKSWYNI